MAEGKEIFPRREFVGEPESQAAGVFGRLSKAMKRTRFTSRIWTPGNCWPTRFRTPTIRSNGRNDNATFFYTVLDAAKRPYKVFRHTLGVKKDTLVYHETDERFTVELEKTSQPRLHPDQHRQLADV